MIPFESELIRTSIKITRYTIKNNASSSVDEASSSVDEVQLISRGVRGVGALLKLSRVYLHTKYVAVAFHLKSIYSFGV